MSNGNGEIAAVLDILVLFALLCSTIREGQGKGEYQTNTGAASATVHTDS